MPDVVTVAPLILVVPPPEVARLLRARVPPTAWAKLVVPPALTVRADPPLVAASTVPLNVACPRPVETVVSAVRAMTPPG